MARSAMTARSGSFPLPALSGGVLGGEARRGTFRTSHHPPFCKSLKSRSLRFDHPGRCPGAERGGGPESLYLVIIRGGVMPRCGKLTTEFICLYICCSYAESGQRAIRRGMKPGGGSSDGIR